MLYRTRQSGSYPCFAGWTVGSDKVRHHSAGRDGPL
jgi:hypothetical protein